jgi:hypothetical protein
MHACSELLDGVYIRGFGTVCKSCTWEREWQIHEVATFDTGQRYECMYVDKKNHAIVARDEISLTLVVAWVLFCSRSGLMRDFVFGAEILCYHCRHFYIGYGPSRYHLVLVRRLYLQPYPLRQSETRLRGCAARVVFVSDLVGRNVR